MGSPKKSHALSKAGAFVFFALLLGGVLIVQFGRFGQRFASSYALFVSFPNAAGIIKNSDVRLRGAKIGRVASSPRLVQKANQSSILLELRIDKGVRIARGARFQIASSGIVGDKFVDVEVTRSDGGNYYTAGEHIEGVKTGGLDAIGVQAEAIAQQLGETLEGSRSVFARMEKALQNIDGLASDFRTTLSIFNTRLLREDNLKAFDQTLADLSLTTQGLRDSLNVLQPAIERLPQTMAALELTNQKVHIFFSQANQTLHLLEPSLKKAPQTLDSLTQASRQLGRVASRLNRPKGVIDLLGEPQISSDIKIFLRNLRRYGILGYRDDASPELSDPRKRYKSKRR